MNVRPDGVPTCVAPRNTWYPVTPETSSVDAFHASATLVLVVPVTRRFAGTLGGCVSGVEPPGSLPNTRTPLSYRGMRCTSAGVPPGVGFTPVIDQSLLGSQAPELAIRNCTSFLKCCCPPG